MLNIHDDILKNILDTAKEFKVDGVVYTKMKNCDLWGGESIFIDDKIREAVSVFSSSTARRSSPTPVRLASEQKHLLK